MDKKKKVPSIQEQCFAELQTCGFSLTTAPIMLCYVENSRDSNSIVVVLSLF